MTDPSLNTSEMDDNEALDFVMDSILNEQRQGRQPKLEEYIKKHPYLEKELREIFPALVFLESFGEESGQSQDLDTAKFSSKKVEILSDYPCRLGDFELKQEIGRGGMGVVFSALQLSLNRPVAIKVLARHLAKDVRFTTRF